MALLITITRDGGIDLIEIVEDGLPIPESLTRRGFLPAKYTDPPTETPDELLSFRSYHPVFAKEGGEYVQRWELRTDRDQARQALAKAEDELSATDYVFTKLLELSMLPAETAGGEASQYDIGRLHEERNALRARINQLRELIRPH